MAKLLLKKDKASIMPGEFDCVVEFNCDWLNKNPLGSARTTGIKPQSNEDIAGQK